MEIQPGEEKVNFLRQTLIAWGKQNFAPFPWRFVENHWHALVAEVMLQRTRADQVAPVFEAFCEKYPTPEAYANDEQSDVFSKLGLQWRRKWLKELADTLTDQEVPHDRSELLALPGIGAYIAAAYRSMHLGLPDTIIDSNVVRLYSRIFGFESDAETRRKKWFKDLAESVTPTQENKAFNYALIDFTRAVCKPKPRCPVCPLQSICVYYATQK